MHSLQLCRISGALGLFRSCGCRRGSAVVCLRAASILNVALEGTAIGPASDTPCADVMNAKTTLSPSSLRSSAVQGGNEDDLVPVLELVLEFTFQFPVGVIDQDQNTGTTKSRQPLLSFRCGAP